MATFKKIIRWLTYLLIIAIAFLTGIVRRDWPVFTLKYEIDIVALIIGIATLAVTLWLAYWVSNVFEKNKDINKNERELSLSKINEFNKHIDNMLSLLMSNSISINVVTSTIKQANILNSSTLDLITKCKTIITDTSFQIEIRNSMNDLNNLMTSYPSTPPVAAGQAEPVQVVSSSYIYTSDRVLQIERKLNTIKDTITSYTLYIIQS